MPGAAEHAAVEGEGEKKPSAAVKGEKKLSVAVEEDKKLEVKEVRKREGQAGGTDGNLAEEQEGIQ